MTESPECIKNIKSRIRSLFRLNPSQKNKTCRDEEGSSIDPTVSPDCKVDIDWDPAEDGKCRKHIGKKKHRLRDSLFSPMSKSNKDANKVKKTTILNHPFQHAKTIRPGTSTKTDSQLPGSDGQAQTDGGDNSKATVAIKIARHRIEADNIERDTVSNDTLEKTACTAKKTPVGTTRPTPKTPDSIDDNKPGFIAPLTSCLGIGYQDCSKIDTEKQCANSKVSAKQDSNVGEEHSNTAQVPSENKNSSEKSTPQSSSPVNKRNAFSDNTVSETEKEKPSKDRDNTFAPSIAIPLPWNVGFNYRGDEKVFVFTGNDSTESTQQSPGTKTQPREEVSVIGLPPSECTTIDRETQCGLDIFPCTCDILADGRRVLCQNCVDVRESVSEDVATVRNENVNSPISQPTECYGRESVQYSSSETQTRLSAFENSSANDSEKPGATNKDKTIGVGSPRREHENELQLCMDGRQEREKPDSQSTLNSTGACCPPPATTGRPQDQGERIVPLVNTVNGNYHIDRATWISKIREKLAKTAAPAQVRKMHELLRLVQRADGERISVVDLANGLTDMTENVAGLVVSAAVEELDRVDGINRTPRSPGNDVNQRVDDGARESPRQQKSQDNLSPVLGAEGGEIVSPSIKRRSSGKSPRVRHSTPESNSNPKRSRSLEDLGLLAIEPSNVAQPFKYRPFDPENTNWEYENPFEISGCIRTDDHIDCGQKAGRGHIPEIKVKQKRRGEPNKHLTTQHQDNQLNPEEELDEMAADNCSGDWTIDDEPSGSMDVPSDTPLCDGDLGAASNLPAEDDDVEEVLPDMRHCEKIPLQVIYGKKNDNEEEFDTPVKHGKKKRKQKDRDRTNRGRPPQILGLRLDI